MKAPVEVFNIEKINKKKMKYALMHRSLLFRNREKIKRYGRIYDKG